MEKRMPGTTVNLDALIPREDFAAETEQAGGSPRTTISVPDLTVSGFFQNNLRKPDFQRETTHWSPSKVVDLIRAFLDRDLIPAVIFWERGNEVFVIDGAHRLSALIAWIRDDYGDGQDSNRFFGAGITDEQRSVADKTRKLVKKEIGTYAEFSGLIGKSIADPLKARRISAIGKGAMIIQWVTAATPEVAEASFFKINQAAQPIDPIERRILQSRHSPNAIASRCIVRGGAGHKYWAGFDTDKRERIEELGRELHDALYKPPHSQPVVSPDQPIAGQGYNALPFIFDLVSLCNDIRIPATITAKAAENPLPPDKDGSKTISMLENVKRRIAIVSTNDPGSLGFHPLIYYYARSGNFLPGAFLASLEFSKKMDQQQKKKDFAKVRAVFENYIFINKVFVSLTINRLGSGARSLTRIATLYWEIFQALREGVTEADILNRLIATKEFDFLKIADVPPPNAELQPSRRGASKESRSAAFIREAMATPIRCHICRGVIHRNSMTFDHIKRKEDGGNNTSDNLRPTHPFCNSAIKN
jgi:hypothetical protein